MPGTEQVLAFPVYPGVTPLDLIGPLTVLKTPGIGGTRYRTVVVGERTEPLATDTPLQLQPRNLLSTGFNALSQWLRANWASFPDLISKHRFSVVILGTSVEWRAPLKFFDGPTLTLTSTLKIQRNGTRAQLDTEVKGATGVAARVGILLCPIEVVELEGLSATPTRVPERLASRLQTDELELDVTPRRVGPDVCAALEKSGKMIGEHKSAGAHGLHPVRFGVCLVSGCDCREFVPEDKPPRS